MHRHLDERPVNECRVLEGECTERAEKLETKVEGKKLHRNAGSARRMYAAGEEGERGACQPEVLNTYGGVGSYAVRDPGAQPEAYCKSDAPLFRHRDSPDGRCFVCHALGAGGRREQRSRVEVVSGQRS